MSDRSDERRDAVIHARVTVDEKERIRKRAQAARMTLTAYVVACSLGERHDRDGGQDG